jgi:hypothetical protein
MAITDLIPIKVKILKGVKNGKAQHIYPDFNLISSEIREGMDWSDYFDYKGIGWHYDKLSGFGEVDAVNPDPDVWYGCTCVPKAFADSAVTLFPSIVTIINESDFEVFYNDRAHVHEPTEIIDTDKLQAIKARRDLGLQDTPEILKALDPNDPTSGVVLNKNKTWELFKSRKGLQIDATRAKAIINPIEPEKI